MHRYELHENMSQLNEITTEAVEIHSATLMAIIRNKRQEGEGRLFPPIRCKHE